MAQNGHYDVIIIGSGAGGGTLAHKLAATGKRISSSNAAAFGTLTAVIFTMSSTPITSRENSTDRFGPIRFSPSAVCRCKSSTAHSARQIVDAVERRLWTPLGLRSLAPEEPGYAPHYQGGVRKRDGSYHQGTVWPWLIGPFVETWLRVRDGTEEAKREARSRFLAPLVEHLNHAGLGHVSEIADGEPLHTSARLSVPSLVPRRAAPIGSHGARRETPSNIGAPCAAM